MNPRKNIVRRRAATLVDVIAGCILMTLVLVPTVSWSHQSATQADRLENHELLLHKAHSRWKDMKVSLLDVQNFSDILSGNYSGTELRGFEPGRVPASHSEIPRMRSLATATAHAMTPEPLLRLEVVCWIDENRNSLLDAEETSERILSLLSSAKAP
ncbi:MAG: hypothetical protein AAF664_19770 [Planctomycetota bacterium]